MARNPRLDAAYATQAKAVRARVLAFTKARFAAGQYYGADEALFVSQVSSVVLAGRRQTAALTDSYLTQVLKSSGLKVPAHKPIDTDALRGVDVAEVYARPFVTVRSKIYDIGINAAIQAGTARLGDIVATDMQLAKTHTAQSIFSKTDGVHGSMRVVSGGKTCALCYIAATQVYGNAELMPIHPGCGCDQVPITDDNPWDQDAMDKQLEDTHAAVFDRLGVSDAGGRAPDYRKITVNQHSEIGPVLGVKGQHFASMGGTKAQAYWRETGATFRGASLKTKPTQDWGRVHADRLLHADAPVVDRERVASLLSQHPEKIVKKIESVTLTPTEAAMHEASMAVGFSKSQAQNVSAFWDGRGITMKPGFDDLTFHHEMGHAVEQFAAKAKVANYKLSYQTNSRFDRHTDYAKTSYGESFAESYAAFVGAGSPLKRVSDPHYEGTFAVLRKVIA